MKLLKHEILKEVFEQILEEKDVAPEAIKHVTSSLIQTSLRGVDSHGINLFPHYCRAVDAGRIKNKPDIKIDLTSGGTINIDADHAFGHHSGSVAVKECIKQAIVNGICAANVHNSTHFGAAAYFALQAAEQDLLCFAFTNADALVKAFNSTDAFFGTNPICFTAPLANEKPFCLDMATSLVSWNKIKNYRREDQELGDGWAYDKIGKPVTNPNSAASLAPIGNYKGFGLGMMIDVLCAILGGGPNGKDLLPMFTSPISARRKISHFFIVIDISKFVDVNIFKQSLQSMVDRIRKMKVDGNEDVMVAGDPEKKSLIIRSEKGIPIHDQVFEEYINISSKFKKSVI